jgi:hypothetical protein
VSKSKSRQVLCIDGVEFQCTEVSKSKFEVSKSKFVVLDVPYFVSSSVAAMLYNAFTQKSKKTTLVPYILVFWCPIILRAQLLGCIIIHYQFEMLLRPLTMQCLLASYHR